MIQIEEQSMRILPVLPLRGLTAFPEMLIHFDVGRALSIKALEIAMKDAQVLFLAAQKDVQLDNPAEEDLYMVGTICTIKQILRLPGDNIRVLVEGRARAYIQKFVKTEHEDACMFAQVCVLEEDEVTIPPRREQALIRTAQDRFEEYAQYAQRIARDVLSTVAGGGSLGYLADFITQNIVVEYDTKQQILEELNPVRRLTKVIRLLAEETEILKLESEIHDEVKEQMDKNQREYYLREQIKVIQSELGDQDVVQEAEEYRQKILALKLGKDAEEKLLREADRMSKLGPNNAESGVVRTYLDTCLALPWHTTTKEVVDLEKAKKILNRDHFGMEKVKERILEFLAVKTLAPELKGQVLCFVGPPGVGKTSIARSIAQAMNRNYVRLSLGGMRDEADIRGHRKTYIGAMPGRVLAAMRQAESKNPLMLLDEIDKMGNDFRGDPASAMLEVLDVEQNNTFRDHYLELPFDLSDVLFVTTANDLGTIPRPLLDRMEVIELGSYTEQEKIQIAKRHLLPKQLKKHGVPKAQVSVSEAMLREIVSGYTREAGVRRLEQVLAKLCRKVAKQIAQGASEKIVVSKNNLEELLGVARYKDDAVAKRDEVGVVNGLAWTSVGGEMLQVEVAAIPGTGKIEVTGNLGTVMQESAKAAVTFVRSRVKQLQIDPMFYKNTDVHIHFPEAAIPKDGPSAGVTITTAIVSALTGAPVRHNVAMTGEVTLRGRVLPIGGLREKTMAAYHAKMKTIVIPKDNESDLKDIEPVVRERVQFVLAEHMDCVLDTAIDFSRRPAPVKIAKVDTTLSLTTPSTHPATDIRQ